MALRCASYNCICELGWLVLDHLRYADETNIYIYQAQIKSLP